MQPLIPPEQADQYRKLQEQAQKHAKKQLKRQQQREKGEPESSSSESEEEPEPQQTEAEAAETAESEQAEMERAAFEAGHQGLGEEGQTVMMPTAQSPLMQQHPTMLISPQPVASPMSLQATPQYLQHIGAQPGQTILVPAHHAGQVCIHAMLCLVVQATFLFLF